MTDNTNDIDQSKTLSDPVCGMAVTQNSEHHIHHADHDYYFCSSSCHDKFVANPGQYVKQDG